MQFYNDVIEECNPIYILYYYYYVSNVFLHMQHSSVNGLIQKYQKFKVSCSIRYFVMYLCTELLLLVGSDVHIETQVTSG